jgi:(4S)-4-hydroxy-5-phosphonooxypentane-2,3-dione isomerase
MGRFVITVDFEIHEDKLREFMPMMLENAEKSRTAEPGCDRFDVLRPDEGGQHVFLYEIYTDKAAFDAHLKTPHFLEFNQRSAPLIKSRSVGRYVIDNDTGT